MNASPTTSMPRALTADHREQLMKLAREVSIPQGTRLVQEGAHVDRFWIIRTGTIRRVRCAPATR
ncbi:cyclic nucleotide-binding domain-containing protein [Streptomyces sp. Agncl-13]|uniref:cyclic nucleotide-binding domain-containing protein n=1 Tax=Streptomyces sp. Agncl-13 TaxID=3400628 RepID=UPI003A835A8E